MICEGPHAPGLIVSDPLFFTNRGILTVSLVDIANFTNSLWLIFYIVVIPSLEMLHTTSYPVTGECGLLHNLVRAAGGGNSGQ